MAVGVRVLRRTKALGTVSETNQSSGADFIIWDDGRREKYKPTVAKDIKIVDNAPAGMVRRI